MQLRIIAFGQAKASPEQELYDDYAKLIMRHGRLCGISQFELLELKEKKGKNDDVLEHALASQNTRQKLIFLDAAGTHMSSEGFSGFLQTHLDGNYETLSFVIGPADGFSAAQLQKADAILSLGSMTLPHLLARVLLAEQLWRALSILTNHPYHRGA